jgi:hypothetical protein
MRKWPTRARFVPRRLVSMVHQCMGLKRQRWSGMRGEAVWKNPLIFARTTSMKPDILHQFCRMEIRWSELICCHAGWRFGAGISLANFRRFWAVAARRNSLRAPLGPRNRSRSSFKMRLRWASNISTFLRRRRDARPCQDLRSGAQCREALPASPHPVAVTSPSCRSRLASTMIKSMRLALSGSCSTPSA